MVRNQQPENCNNIRTDSNPYLPIQALTSPTCAMNSAIMCKSSCAQCNSTLLADLTPRTGIIQPPPQIPALTVQREKGVFLPLSTAKGTHTIQHLCERDLL